MLSLTAHEYKRMSAKSVKIELTRVCVPLSFLPSRLTDNKYITHRGEKLN